MLDRNIRALVARREGGERRRGWQDRLASAITAFTGSMTFVYLHVAFFGAWILWNLPFSPLPRFDPSFVALAMVASVEAIFLSTFVLITQNRMQAVASERADLDLQVNLLAEHEVTRLLRLVKAIADRLGIEDSDSDELPPLERDVAPEEVLEHMDRVARERHEHDGEQA